MFVNMPMHLASAMHRGPGFLRRGLGAHTPQGFSLRVAYAKKCLLAKSGTSERTFDDCFESGDGRRVVIALMGEAQGDPDLAKAIEDWAGPTLLKKWQETYALARRVALFPEAI